VEIDLKELLEAGAHFGHQTRRWNPKMSQYIFTKKNNIHIIDLIKTAEKLKEVLVFVESITKAGGTILFVGTKTQAQKVIKEEAEKCDSPYVSHKWLGGMMTNFSTVSDRIRYMEASEIKIEEDKFINKKDKLDAIEEVGKLNVALGGIRKMKKLPNVLFIVDIIKERNAVKEAQKLKIPIIAIVDTNANPEEVDYIIPANDDAIKTIGLIVGMVSETVNKSKETI